MRQADGGIAPNYNVQIAADAAPNIRYRSCICTGKQKNTSQGVTRDQLVWTADAYIRSETYQAALVRIIDAHHRLPVAALWGAGTTSSSDGQFFRSGKRGNVAGEINARYGVDPGFSFYTHVSDQHAPYHVRVISAATHEAPYVLDACCTMAPA